MPRPSPARRKENPAPRSNAGSREHGNINALSTTTPPAFDQAACVATAWVSLRCAAARAFVALAHVAGRIG